MGGSCLQRHNGVRWQERRRSCFCILCFRAAHLLLQQHALCLPPCDQVRRDREDPPGCQAQMCPTAPL